MEHLRLQKCLEMRDMVQIDVDKPLPVGCRSLSVNTATVHPALVWNKAKGPKSNDRPAALLPRAELHYLHFGLFMANAIISQSRPLSTTRQDLSTYRNDQPSFQITWAYSSYTIQRMLLAKSFMLWRGSPPLHKPSSVAFRRHVRCSHSSLLSLFFKRASLVYFSYLDSVIHSSHSFPFPFSIRLFIVFIHFISACVFTRFCLPS